MAKLLTDRFDRVSDASVSPAGDSMRAFTMGDCFCPFTGTSINLYELAYAAARFKVARAEQAARDLELARCN